LYNLVKRIIMKNLKLGIILLLILGLNACTSKVNVSELTDEVIRVDLATYLQIYDPITIDKFTYEKTKISDTRINAVGEVIMTTQLGKLTGSVTLGFVFNENKWVLVNKYFSVTNAVLNQDERIRDDAYNLVSYFATGQFKDITYTLSEYKSNEWKITGEITIETSQGTQIGSFILGYRLEGTSWTMYDSQYKLISVIDTSTEPTAQKAFYRFQESFFSNNDAFIEYDQMTSIEQSIDLANGTAIFIYHYTITDSLRTTNFSVTITGQHQENGWIYNITDKSYDEVLNYEGTYHLTWDILDTETFYINNETMTLVLTGQIKISGTKYYSDYELHQNNVEATVIFRGLETKVTPTLTYEGSFSCITMKYGTSEKEVVSLCYNEEDYRGGIMAGPIFYGISFDQSHAIVR
jgi:hypothetical protein